MENYERLYRRSNEAFKTSNGAVLNYGQRYLVFFLGKSVCSHSFSLVLGALVDNR